MSQDDSQDDSQVDNQDDGQLDSRPDSQPDAPPETPAPAARARKRSKRDAEPQVDVAPVAASQDIVLDLQKSLTWLLPFAMLVCAIVAVPLRILAEEGLPRYRALQAEQVDLDAQNDRMRREVRDLQREVEALRSDPGAIERIARDELGMVRPGEVIFQFNE